MRLIDAKPVYDGNDLTVVMSRKADIDAEGVLAHALAAASDPDADPAMVNQIIDILNQEDHIVQNISEQARADVSGSLQVSARSVSLAAQDIVTDRIQAVRSGINFGDDFEQNAFSYDGGSVWGQMMYAQGNHKERDDEAAFKNKTYGLVIGADAAFNNQFRLGVAATYGYGVINTDDNRTTSNHNLLGTIYTSWEYEDYFFDTMGTYGAALNETRRFVHNDYVSGDYDSTQMSFRIGIGRRLRVNDWEVSPLAELNYGLLQYDSYKEKGSVGLEQNIDIGDYSVIELGLGVIMTGNIKAKKGEIRPEFRLIGHRDLQSNGARVEYSYLAGGSPTIVEGPSRAKERYQVGMGLRMDLYKRWSMRAAYDYHWSKYYGSHTFNARLRYDF